MALVRGSDVATPTVDISEFLENQSLFERQLGEFASLQSAYQKQATALAEEYAEKDRELALLRATRTETADQKTRSIRRHQEELEELRKEFEVRKARIASSLKAEQKVFESVTSSNQRRETELEAEMRANQHDRKMLVAKARELEAQADAARRMHSNYTSRVSQLNHEYALMAKVGHHSGGSEPLASTTSSSSSAASIGVDKRLRLPQPSANGGSPSTAPTLNGMHSTPYHPSSASGTRSPLVGGSISPAPRYTPAAASSSVAYANGSPGLRPQPSSASRTSASPYRSTSGGMRSTTTTQQQREASYELFDQQLQETELI